MRQQAGRRGLDRARAGAPPAVVDLVGLAAPPVPGGAPGRGLDRADRVDERRRPRESPHATPATGWRGPIASGCAGPRPSRSSAGSAAGVELDDGPTRARQGAPDVATGNRDHDRRGTKPAGEADGRGGRKRGGGAGSHPVRPAAPRHAAGGQGAEAAPAGGQPALEGCPPDERASLGGPRRHDASRATT